jgi:hypothetical protein
MWFERKTTPGIAELRQELALAERQLRELAVLAAERFAQQERAAGHEALEACRDYDRIRARAEARLAESRAADVVSGSGAPPGRVVVFKNETPERFPGEEQLAELAIRAADFADAAYTVIAFGSRDDRMRFLRGGTEREAVIREAIERGGAYTDRKFFMEIATG